MSPFKGVKVATKAQEQVFKDMQKPAVTKLAILSAIKDAHEHAPDGFKDQRAVEDANKVYTARIHLMEFAFQTHVDHKHVEGAWTAALSSGRINPEAVREYVDREIPLATIASE